jgi:hypothetical protein
MADDASRSCLTSGFVIPGFLLRPGNHVHQDGSYRYTARPPSRCIAFCDWKGSALRKAMMRLYQRVGFVLAVGLLVCSQSACFAQAFDLKELPDDTVILTLKGTPLRLSRLSRARIWTFRDTIPDRVIDLLDLIQRQDKFGPVIANSQNVAVDFEGAGVLLADERDHPTFDPRSLHLRIIFDRRAGNYCPSFEDKFKSLRAASGETSQWTLLFDDQGFGRRWYGYEGMPGVICHVLHDCQVHRCVKLDLVAIYSFNDTRVPQSLWRDLITQVERKIDSILGSHRTQSSEGEAANGHR